MIAVVDDDPIVREATADLISSLGYTALAFDSAEQFLDSGQAENTACLITDLHLPGISGFELQTQLRSEGYRMPIIFITGFPEAKVQARALAAGAVAFLAKPFEQVSLVNYLGIALNDPSTC